MEGRIQAKVTRNDITMPITIEVGKGDGIPETAKLLGKVVTGVIFERLSCVEKNLNRHELATDDEVGSAIQVDVFPLGIRDHSRKRIGAWLLHESMLAFVDQHIAFGGRGISTGFDPATYEKIHVPISIHITGPHA